jgi:hypothetical protein
MAAGGEGGEAPQLRLQVARKERLPKAAGGEEEEAPEGSSRRKREMLPKAAVGERGRGSLWQQVAREERPPT